MTLTQAMKRMKENPGLKMWMPNHYRSHEYNYYDGKKKKYLTETGDVWNIELSKYYNEIDGYEDYNGGKR